jgi:ribosome maturation factor RimP
LSWLDAVERTVVGLGYDLVDTEKASRGLVRVFIDRLPGDVASGGFITVEDCERVTRQLQQVLEVENLAYERLEVSSPGLDRPLNKPADYRRFAGQQIEITLKVAFNNRKKYRGELALHDDPAGGSSDERYRLILKDDKHSEQVLGFELHEVREARLVPVLDFKGRRFLPKEAEPTPQTAEAAAAAQEGDPQA